jgi:hypothetical protein
VPPRGTWLDPLMAAVRGGRAAKVALTAPKPGRLDVRLLDARGHQLAKRTLTYGKAGRKTLKLPKVERAKILRVAWTPRAGKPQVVRQVL